MTPDEIIKLLRNALPDPEKLETLAIFFDALDAVQGVQDRWEVQDDLRQWATLARNALNATK